MIYSNPIKEVTKKIEHTEKDMIFLTGTRKSGKSTVINYYKNKNRDNFIVDCSNKFEDYFIIPDHNLARLYYTCIIINKIIEYIKINHNKEYNNFCMYEFVTNKIINEIKNMVTTLNYGSRNIIFNEEFYENPNIILDDFLDTFVKRFGKQILTILIDNFDSYGSSSYYYQNAVYSSIKNRMKGVLVVSDETVLNSERKKTLETNNEIIEVNYSFDPETVKEILDTMYINEQLRNNKLSMIVRLRFILDENTIKKMIFITNGNLYEMYTAYKNLINNIDNLNPKDYSKYITDYLCNKSYFEESYKRCLHIN